jgi:hypothetical protein
MGTDREHERLQHLVGACKTEGSTRELSGRPKAKIDAFIPTAVTGVNADFLQPVVSADTRAGEAFLADDWPEAAAIERSG